jgi:hypothetical protein
MANERSKADIVDPAGIAQRVDGLMGSDGGDAIDVGSEDALINPSAEAIRRRGAEIAALGLTEVELADRRDQASAKVRALLSGD